MDATGKAEIEQMYRAAKQELKTLQDKIDDAPIYWAVRRGDRFLDVARRRESLCQFREPTDIVRIRLLELDEGDNPPGR